MKRTIRTFIAKIPLAKPLYNAAKRWRNILVMKMMQPVIGHLRARKEGKRETDEFRAASDKQELLREGAPEAFQDLPLHVQWEITKYCNFRCSYCFQGAGGHPNIYCSLDQAKKAIEHLASANRPSYQIYLLGGEPLTHPNLIEIVKLLDNDLGEKIQVLRFLTNGSFRKGQFEELIQAARHFPLLLSISVHFEFNKPERIIRFVKDYANKTSLELGLLFHPEYFDALKETAEKLTELRKEYPFYMMISKLQEPPSFSSFDSRYTPELFKWAEEAEQLFKLAALEGPKVKHNRDEEFGRTHFFTEKETGQGVERKEYTSYAELDKDTKANFSGMYCSAGTMVMSIWPDGKTKGTRCRVAPIVCNIYEENPFKRDDWMQCIQCTRKWCSDVANRRTAKFRSEKDAKKYIAECKKKQKNMLEQYRDEPDTIRLS